MSNKKPYQKKTKGYLAGQAAKPFTILSKPPVLSILIFVLLSLLFSLLIYQRYQLVEEANKKEAYEIVNHAKDLLQETLTYSLSATKTLTFFIDKNGRVNNFDSIAAQILESAKDIDALQLVPGGVIQYVYPLKGNEKVIGYNILEDPFRNKEARKAIEKKQMFFAGPFELRQGGMGVVGRLPVYRNSKFWGFSAVVIKMATLFKTAGIDTAGKDGYYFQLSKINPDTKAEEFFLSPHKELAHSQSVSVDVPDGDWKLSVSIAAGQRGFGDIVLLALVGFLFSALGAFFVYRFAIQPQKLNELVINRTRELKTSENNYRSLIERVSDAFVAIDKDWVFTYVNERAGEIFAKDPQSLIGKNIWDEFPEAVGQPFYHAYYRAMQTQEYQYLEAYYTAFSKWLENHIYPSEDGLTIFFKDVTDIKEITQELRDKEEKYRSLIEQASDGIVITDLEGIILEINNSMKKMIGVEDEELIGYHVTDYIPDEDKELLPLRINELMQGKSLLYDRRLLKKDGTFLDVEVNSKMASSHTLIGFIRDITERKKYEKTLRYQARLLESVSDAVTSIDIHRSIVSWNKACFELYGFTSEEAMGKKIPELVIFEYPGTTNEEVFKKVYSEGQWKGEFNFIHPKTKEKLFLLSSINLLKNDKGDVSGFIITSKNITNRKKAEEIIQRSNERFELIGKATNDAVWEWNLETSELWGNEAHQQLYGLTEADPVPDDTEWRNRLHPDDRQRMTETVAEALASDSNAFEAEYRLFTENKGWRYIFGSTYIDRNKEGKAVRLMGNMTDITERKRAAQALLQSEQKYRLLFYNNPLPMWMATIPHLDIIDVNEAAIKQYGYSRDEFIKLNAKDMRPPEDVEHFVKEVEKMKPGINNTRSWRHKKKDGTILHVEIYSHEIMYEGKRVWLGLSHDVTEKYESKQLLEKSYEDIRQLVSSLQSIREDERTSIAREIHDELGQQLTGLKMDMHWLSRKINSTDPDITGKMKESIELINTTIASVRKISTNLRPSILDDLGLLAALEWQGEEFEKRSGTKVIFINKVGEITVQPQAATGIFRIYQELLTNIARHANASEVRAVLHKDENMLYFTINDNGVGFDLDNINHKKTLGLLGIKERTLLLGGTYEFNSRPGQGSVTTISIPLSLVNNPV